MNADHSWRLKGIGFLAEMVCVKCGKPHSKSSEPCTKESISITLGAAKSLKSEENVSWFSKCSAKVRYHMPLILQLVVYGMCVFAIYHYVNNP